MINHIPTYITATFIVTTLLTLLLLYTTIKKSSFAYQANKIIGGFLVWLIIQGVLSYNLFYLNTAGNIPPLFPLLGFIPLFIMMGILLSTKWGKKFLDSLPIQWLTLISVVRIPVEMVLLWLFLQDTLPQILTFEGRNFDILAGITAPLIVYFGFVKKTMGKKMLMLWNIVGILLLLNIIVHAVLSFPTFIQKFGLDVDQFALIYFPFFWLPSFVAPLVLFSHFVSIRQLTIKQSV